MIKDVLWHIIKVLLVIISTLIVRGLYHEQTLLDCQLRAEVLP